MRLTVGLCLFLVTGAFADEWKAKLADADPTARLEAAAALAEGGAADAVPDLTECLIDHDSRLRAAAARALGRAGPAAKSALPELVRLFKDEQREVRIEACAAVARIGDLDAVDRAARLDWNVIHRFGAEHEDVLRALLASDSWHVRLWVLQHKLVRNRVGDAWVAPLAALARDDPAQVVRLYAVGALANMRKAEAAPALIERSTAPDSRVRAAAVIGLRRQSLENPAVVRALEARLEDDVSQIRAHACFGLIERKQSAAKSENLLTAAEPDLRLVAAVVLGKQGTWHASAGDLIVSAAVSTYGFKEPYPVVLEHERNLRAGGGEGWGGAATHYPSVGRLALEVVLESKGKAVPALERAYRSEKDSHRRVGIVCALGQLAATDSLASALKDSSEDVRRTAAASRAWLGAADDPTAKVLVGCLREGGHLDDRSLDWVATATPLILKMGESALPALETRLSKIPQGVTTDHGNGAESHARSAIDADEEKQVRQLIRLIRVAKSR